MALKKSKSDSKAGIMKMVRAVVLRQYRLDKKITATAIIGMLPFNNSKLSQLENGYWGIKESEAEIVLKVYGLTVSEFEDACNKLYSLVSDEILDMRTRCDWLSLYRCTRHVIEQHIRKGYNLYGLVAA